jgi:hypothetical protein
LEKKCDGFFSSRKHLKRMSVGRIVIGPSWQILNVTNNQIQLEVVYASTRRIRSITCLIGHPGFRSRAIYGTHACAPEKELSKL